MDLRTKGFLFAVGVDSKETNPLKTRTVLSHEVLVSRLVKRCDPTPLDVGKPVTVSLTAVES
jgi:hypothetical protein